MAEQSADPLWTPSERRVASSAMDRFRRAAAADLRRDLDDPEALHRWSVEEPEEFWGLLFDTLMPGVERRGPALVQRDGAAFGAGWFPDTTLNVAEVVLGGNAHAGRAQEDAVMMVSVDERGRRREVTRAQARAEVAAIAAALRADGVREGDRVAVWLPNTDVAMLVMLAAASIGAVFSSTSPDFGVDGVLDRFTQIEPKVLVAADGYTYGGKDFDRRPQLAEIMGGLPS
jgi:acetoacetyl-CoA synthetase